MFYLFIFRHRGRQGKREGENISVWLLLERCILGTWPATQACAPTGNQTGDPMVRRPHIGTQSTEPHQPAQKKFYRSLFEPD